MEEIKNMNEPASIWFILFGAFLALITSLVVEIYKNWAQNKNNEKDFKIILKLEIKGILKRLKNLLVDSGKVSFSPLQFCKSLL